MEGSDDLGQRSNNEMKRRNKRGDQGWKEIDTEIKAREKGTENEATRRGQRGGTPTTSKDTHLPFQLFSKKKKREEEKSTRIALRTGTTGTAREAFRPQWPRRGLSEKIKPPVRDLVWGKKKRAGRKEKPGGNEVNSL